jgi:hypothetical protein
MSVTGPISKDDIFRVLCLKKIKAHGYESKANFCRQKMYMSTITFYTKWNSPDRFLVEEIRRLFEVLNFTPEEKDAVL